MRIQRPMTMYCSVYERNLPNRHIVSSAPRRYTEDMSQQLTTTAARCLTTCEV